MDNVTKAKNALTGILVNFMPDMERKVLLSNLDSEEKEGIAEIVLRAACTIETMPKTYEQDGKGMDAIAYLHYFYGSMDAWITEKDMGDGTEDKRQHQAFGYACLTGRKIDGELGYISIQELIENGVELDLYWIPKPLKEIIK